MSTIKVGSLVRFPSESARDEALIRVQGTRVNGVPLERIPLNTVFVVTKIEGTSCRIELPSIGSQPGNWTYLPCLKLVTPSPIL